MDKRFGEPVALDSLDTTPIPGSNFFGSMEGVDNPFKVEDTKKAKVNSEYTPTIEKKKEEKSEKVVVSDKIVQKYIPNSAASSQLKAFRELFGLKRIDVKYYTTKRLNSLGEEVTMTFGLRPLNFEDFQWVTEKSSDLMNLSIEQLGISLSTSWTISYKQANVAMSICTLDEGVRSTENPGTPIWKIFGIEPTDPLYIKDPNYPHVIVRAAAASVMLEELRSTFYDIVTDLYTAITTMIDNEYAEVKEKESPLALTTSKV